MGLILLGSLETENHKTGPGPHSMGPPGIRKSLQNLVKIMKDSTPGLYVGGMIRAILIPYTDLRRT